MDYSNFSVNISSTDEFFPEFDIVQGDINSIYLKTDNPGSYIQLTNINGKWNVMGTNKQYDIEFINKSQRNKLYKDLLTKRFTIKSPSPSSFRNKTIEKINLKDLPNILASINMVVTDYQLDNVFIDSLFKDYNLPLKREDQNWRDYYFMLTTIPGVGKYNLISEYIDGVLDYNEFIQLIIKYNPKQTLLDEIEFSYDYKYPLIEEIRKFYIDYVRLNVSDNQKENVNKMKYIIKWIDSIIGEKIY